MIDDAARTVLRARDDFLSSSSALDKLTGVRPHILDSWRRSLSYGLDPERCTPMEAPITEASARLRRLAGVVVNSKRVALEQSSCSLALTDTEGRLLNRWVTDGGFAATLDAKLIMPDFSVAEAATGTGSSSIVLETGVPASVAGPEHFNQTWIDFTCAGAPIRHPITRRLVGSLNLTVRYSDTSPVLLSWVTDIAAEIEQALLHSASVEEKLLLSAFLAAKRDARHPVLCLNDRTVISNAPAARMLGPVDQALIWEVASNTLSTRDGGTSLTLTDGMPVWVDVEAVSNGGAPIGAVVRIRAEERPERSEHRAGMPNQRIDLPGLVGTSSAWRRLCAQAASVADASTLVIGEEGVGKMAVASSLLRGAGVVIDAERGDDTQDQWLVDLRAACDEETSVVLRHIDKLDPAWAGPTTRLLDEARTRGVRVCATATVQADDERSTSLLDWFDEIIDVPPLSQRIDDFDVLLHHLSARHGASSPSVRWLPDAVQLMTRVAWSRNVASLERAVRQVMANHRSSVVTATDLPAEIRARASRRALVGLEQVEARAIIEALRDADGNKRLAAEKLGIARSTLYRKVRMLGIDLGASNF